MPEWKRLKEFHTDISEMCHKSHNFATIKGSFGPAGSVEFFDPAPVLFEPRRPWRPESKGSALTKVPSQGYNLP